MNDTLNKQHKKYIKKMESLVSDKINKDLFDSLLLGKNNYLRLTRKGSSVFDPTWISVIEDCLYDLGEIVNNPREVTKEENYVTPIELAKKINAQSVQHLASHTQYIKEVDEKGNVNPSKILSSSNVEDIHTYENRFIATFIRRLILFIEKRYEFISKQIDLTVEDVLYVKNKTNIDGMEVEIETKIKLKQEGQDEDANKAKEYISRIEILREYISYYYNSKFMKLMKTEKDVRNPIIQTNIIRKNPKYRKCYETFLFIERFDSLGVSYNLNEQYQTFNEEERNEINYLMLGSLLSLKNDSPLQVIKENIKTYKPKILKSIDDEEFIYSDKYKGPIEFVRVDDSYREYLKNHLNKDMPIHPNNFEKEFYSDEYTFKRDLKTLNKELDQLLNRKNKAAQNYEKEILNILEERKRKEIEAEENRIKKEEDEKEALINKKRNELINNAKDNLNEIKDDPLNKKIVVASAISQRDILESVPGKYIVKTSKGYYVDDNKFSELKNSAYVFHDFNKANHTRKKYNGKVIKL